MPELETSAGKVSLDVVPQVPARVPSLDGLRAISIGMVLLGHLDGTRYFPIALPCPHLLANMGVRIFFVISGFLITMLLLKEWGRLGHISLRDFYWRRAFRIFPAFYVYLGVVVTLWWGGWIQLLPGDLMSALTYTMDYHHPHSWSVGHLWSLAVEEQFYLIWPAALVLAGPSRALKAAGGVLLAAPYVRLATWTWAVDLRPHYGQQFEAVADALATGCLLAGLYNRLGRWNPYQRFLRSRWCTGVPAAVFALLASLDKPRISLFLGQTFLNLSILMMVERSVRYPSTLSGRCLNLRPLRFIGVMSYSLYLWQQLFVNRQGQNWSTAFPYNLLLASGAALISYYAVEKPFLRLKERLHRKMGSGPGGLGGK